MVENLQFPRCIIPFCLLQLPLGPGAEMSILAGIHHVPASAMLRWLSAISHALSQRWLPPLEVNDDSVYGVLLALGGLTSLNKCNEYI